MKFIKENKSKLRFSKMRSNAGDMLPKKEMIRSPFRGEGGSRRTVKNKKTLPTKPSHLSKRSVSLPTDLDNTALKTQKLFWFIPKDNRHQRRRPRCDNGYVKSENSLETAGLDEEQQIESRRISHERRMPLCQDIPGKVALEWITTSSTHSLSDSSTSEQSDDYCNDDDHDGPLLGLEFVDFLIE
jgi:hypothetical protein